MTLMSVGNSSRPFQSRHAKGVSALSGVTHSLTVDWLNDTGADWSAVLPNLAANLVTTTPALAVSAPTVALPIASRRVSRSSSRADEPGPDPSLSGDAGDRSQGVECWVEQYCAALNREPRTVQERQTTRDGSHCCGRFSASSCFR